MPMRATTVRFADDLWRLLEAEASRSGVSSAQFVRDATILRLAFLAAERRDPEATLTLEQVAAGALRGGPAAAAAPPSPAPGVLEHVAEAVREPVRLAAVRVVRDVSPEQQDELDRLTKVAARLADAPVALVSLVDEDEQVFAGCVGLSEPWQSRRGTPLTHSFCQHAVAARKPLLVSDAREHPILKTNLAIRDLDVVAYAGLPLTSPEGQMLGTLCVIDSVPRSWRPDQVDLLKDLAATVSRRLAAD